MKLPDSFHAMQTFRKEERLNKKKLFEKLFAEGKSISEYPVRLVWLIEKNTFPFPAQAAFSVPKKRFKKAVIRNKLKRQMREIYRLHKQDLYVTLEKAELKGILLFIYSGNAIISFQELKSKVTTCIENLKNKISQAKSESL